MKTTRTSRQRGAALIIGLILLAIITLLAVVGMNISNAELASAVSEQLRMRAFRAAETGLEHGLDDMFSVAAATGAKVETEEPVGVDGSPVDSDDEPIDTYSTTVEFRGEGNIVSGFTSKFSAFHYSVLSRGASARNASATLEVGAYVVNDTGGQQSFAPL
ncbi:MAG TPA: PilX N-terminal domain-containing pilus assembly protein [Steroidobacteraceae bacterium]|nr:PilX N-terminal domain-containing pilus assembly protein [Steroidobacteraceae bacterium]